MAYAYEELSRKVMAPEDIELRFNMFHSFDRSSIVKCIKTIISQGESRDLMVDLLRATTITTFTPNVGDPPKERWFYPSDLVPQTATQLSWPAKSQAAHSDKSQISQVVDLYKLFNLLPSGEGDHLAMLSFRWQVALGIVYSLTAIASFLLNVFTVIVLSQQSQKGELRMYLINLSLSDLLMSCFSIPVTYTEFMLGSWIFPHFLCPIAHLVVTLCVFVSTTTMIAIGLNRRKAIMNPLSPLEFPKISHFRIKQIHVILAIWLLGIVLSTPEYLMFRAAPFCFNQKLYFECRTIWPDPISDFYTIFIFLSTFLIPLSVLSYIYIKLARVMWNHNRPGNEHVSQAPCIEGQRNKVSKMLLVVVVGFVVFWLPIQTHSLVYLLFPDLKDIAYGTPPYNIVIAVYFTSHWLSMAHSLLNPLIYGFMSRKFRSEFKRRLCWSGSSARRTTAGLKSSGLAANSSAMFDERGPSLQRPIRSLKLGAKANGADEAKRTDSGEALAQVEIRPEQVEQNRQRQRRRQQQQAEQGRGGEMLVVAEFDGRDYASRLGGSNAQVAATAAAAEHADGRAAPDDKAVSLICCNSEAAATIHQTTIPIIGTLHEEVEEGEEEEANWDRPDSLDNGQDVALGPEPMTRRTGRSGIDNRASRTESQQGDDFRHKRQLINRPDPLDESPCSTTCSSPSAAANV